jgi:hypothetical protein
MSEDLLKVKLSPANGQMQGTFTEGMPVAEGIGMVFAIQIDGKEGERIRRYGQVIGVHDNLLNLDNKSGSYEQVVTTTIYFHEMDPLIIAWHLTSIAVADIATEDK